MLAAVKNAICGTPLGLVIERSVACYSRMGSCPCCVRLDVATTLNAQHDREVKLAATQGSHSRSRRGIYKND